MEREDLHRLRAGMKNLESLRERIAVLETKKLSPRSVAYGSERVQSSTKGDVLTDQIIKIDELIERYRAELDRMLALQLEFEDMIVPLAEKEKKIMRYYYIDGLIWEEVWEKTGISTRHLKRIRDRVLDELFPVADKC